MPELISGHTRVRVERQGARIASLVVRGVELLWTAPWAEIWDGDDVGDEVAVGYPASDSNAEWHRRYPGGWHTMVPNAGDAAVVDGIEHPFHGEAAWRRWALVRADRSSCTLRIALRTVPLIIERTVSAVDGGVWVTQRVTSYGAAETFFTWVEHPTLDAAILSPATRVLVGGRDSGVRVPAPDRSHAGMTTVPDEEGVVIVDDSERGLRITLTTDCELFPLLQIWQEHRAGQGEPWWGVVDALAIEPSAAAYGTRQAGDALGPLRLGPGESIEATFTLTAVVER